MIFGRLPTVPGDEEVTDPSFHHQHNTGRRSVFHVHASLSSPMTCRCFESVSLPENRRRFLEHISSKIENFNILKYAVYRRVINKHKKKRLRIPDVMKNHVTPYIDF